MIIYNEDENMLVHQFLRVFGTFESNTPSFVEIYSLALSMQGKYIIYKFTI